MSECSSCSPNQLRGAVCGTDGKTYNSECKLKQAGCKNVRRQGNYYGEGKHITNIFNSGHSFQSAMLKISVAHAGACEEPCAGMEGMGQFRAFNSRATNSGQINV
jgi:hypothetical protein